MSKAVMLSIRPKWCEKIANGEKTIEVRKTRPKMNTPFKCYIYCTLPKYPHEDFIATDYPRPQFYGGGKVIGEFTCDQIFPINVFDNGSNGKTGYGWHISDLLIYDQPRELSEFQRATDPCVFCMERIARECTDCKKWGGDIKRPPQSWCYVEAMKDD